MKKVLFIMIILLLIILPGCGTPNGDNGQEPDNGVIPPNNEENQEEEPPDTPEETEYSIEDYYPIFSDKEYIYEGEGSEYASYNLFIDYLDRDTNRVQTRTNDSGTEMVRVIENKDGKLSVILSQEEVYYRDNLLGVEASEEESDVLLMEPLVKGTQWTLSDDRKRSITETGVEINTPLGDYQALEVTTEGPDSIIKDYYAPEVGLVKTIFSSEGIEITSTLSEINEDVALRKNVEFYYPDQDGEIYLREKELSFNTNDITRITLQNQLREEPPEESYLPLISQRTRINYMYLGNDNIAYIDFSKDFINDMNAGAYYESMILQSLINTIGTYYGVERVYLTIDGNPYESGHLLFKEGEILTVDLDNIVR